MARFGYAEAIKEIGAHLERDFGQYEAQQLADDLSITAAYSASISEIAAAAESAYRKEQGSALSSLPENLRAYEKEIVINERTADYRYWRDYAQNLSKAVYARMDALRTVISNKRQELKTLGAQEH